MNLQAFLTNTRKILEETKTPLAFIVLTSLFAFWLITKGIGVCFENSNLGTTLIIAGIVVILLDLVIVAVITIKDKTKGLVYTAEDHLKDKAIWGDKNNPKTKPETWGETEGMSGTA